MSTKTILIISPLPLKPVKSGMQNTIYLLSKFLREKKHKIIFYNIQTNNKIDPILNLKKKELIKIEIKKKINLKKIDLVLVNTTKILFQYKSILLSKQRDFKTILVCHDLYYFRKKYFDKINIKDKTSFKFSNEINILKNTDYIIDFSKKEYEYLLKKKIPKKKFIKTSTPAVNFKKIEVLGKKKYDILYIASNWFQNHLSLKNFFNKVDDKKTKFKYLVLGDLSIKDKQDINVKPYAIEMFKKCKIGIAMMKNSTGRKTKIFEMMSAGLPVFTNINLKEFGLRNNYHYKYFDKKRQLAHQLKLFLSNTNLRKKISNNAFKWSKKNTFYQKAFMKLNKEILR